MSEQQTESKLKLFEKLLLIQDELDAPKNQYNSHGNYNYRSCEDILGAVKPLNKKHKTVTTLSDAIELIGDRYYVAATATLYDLESEESIEVKAYAREALDRKGMDDSQITGASSSYARKYALNGLFNIDDTKDADTNEHRKQTTASNTASKPATTSPAAAAPTTSTAKVLPGDPECEVPGCRNTIWKSKETANRKYHKGHIICKFHSENGDWESQVTKTLAQHGEEVFAGATIDTSNPPAYSSAVTENVHPDEVPV